MGINRRNRVRRLADHLRRARALLHESRVGPGCVGCCGPVRSASLEALSSAPASDQVFGRARRARRSNGAETPRLLFLSESSQFPHGLANSSGKVGKYLMFNGHASSTGLFEHPLNEFKSVPVSRVIHDFYDSDPKRGFYGGGGMDMRFISYPMNFALPGLPTRAPRCGRQYKDLLGDH